MQDYSGKVLSRVILIDVGRHGIGELSSADARALAAAPLKAADELDGLNV